MRVSTAVARIAPINSDATIGTYGRAVAPLLFGVTNPAREGRAYAAPRLMARNREQFHFTSVDVSWTIPL